MLQGFVGCAALAGSTSSPTSARCQTPRGAHSTGPTAASTCLARLGSSEGEGPVCSSGPGRTSSPPGRRRSRPLHLSGPGPPVRRPRTSTAGQDCPAARRIMVATDRGQITGHRLLRTRRCQAAGSGRPGVRARSVARTRAGSARRAEAFGGLREQRQGGATTDLVSWGLAESLVLIEAHDRSRCGQPGCSVMRAAAMPHQRRRVVQPVFRSRPAKNGSRTVESARPT